MTAAAPEALQVPSEVARMVALYRERKPRRVLEIGVWQGGTLREWVRHALTGAQITAVDLDWKNYAQPVTVLVDVAVFKIAGSSHDRAVKGKIRARAPFDWAFIDGDHSAEGVLADVRLVLPLMAPGGLLLLHDIEPPEGVESYPPGVLFRQMGDREGFRTFSFVDPAPQPVSHGIGVVLT